MKFDREAALRSAEKAVQAGKIDHAIAEYLRIVEQQPRDLNSANTLGDLYARAGQVDSAVAHYTRIAEHLLAEGFLPKASALFKKMLKIQPENEHALLQLGTIAAKQGLLADARTSMHAVAAKRRARGDIAGADEILIALADVDAGDVEGRMQAARILAGRGQGPDAAARLRDLAVDLLEKERPDEAIDVLRETVHLVPGDRIARKQLIGLLNDLGQESEAEVYLTREVAADDPAMLLLVAKGELQSGRLDEGREDIRRALAHQPAAADVMAFMRQIAPRLPEAAFIAADALADAAIGHRRVAEAVDVLNAFLEAAPAHVGGALRLVEICLEEGLDQTLAKAQCALADAYIASGQGESARVIAEDLASAEPGNEDARRRLVRAYAAAGLPDPEAQAVAFLNPDAAFPPFDPGTTEPTAAEPAAPAPAPIEPDADLELPAFDVYVYDQPSPPLEPLEPEPVEPEPGEPRTKPVERAEPVEPMEPAESEEALVSRLLAEEAGRIAPKPETAVPEIDLTSTLDALDEEPPAAEAVAPLEEVFDGFRERNRVEEHERAEAAYEEAELAAALGQMDDALRLYGEASRSPLYRFRAASALARLLRSEGRVPEAIEWLERASEVPAPDRDAGFALMYDLADMLEGQGESMRALAIFMELHAEAGDYRGIAARVERLARAEIGG
ncbi:MAG: tetratricopeptide repeat protein [Vicinamibacterales bacterium]